MFRTLAISAALGLLLALPATAQPAARPGNGVGPGANTTAPSQVRGLAGWTAEPLFTVGEVVAGYQPPGLFDGLGALTLDHRTVRLFANHELSPGRGPAYTLANGTTLRGARVSFFDVNKNNRKLVGAGLAYHTIVDRAGQTVTPGSAFADLNRLCSSALFAAGTYGLVDDVYFTGEETSGGTEFALDARAGVLYAAPWLGRAAWENVTLLDTGDPATVAVLIGDDRAGAPLLLYVGRKNANPNAPAFLDRNGLAMGTLHVWVADSGETTPQQFNGTTASRSGRFAAIAHYDAARAGTPGYDALGFATQSTQNAQATAAGAFRFSRPEDLATNPADGTQAIFASTGRGDLFPADAWGTTYLVDVDFGATITAQITVLYDGDDAGGSAYPFAGPDFGLRSPDNLDWAGNGMAFVQEDRSIDAFGLTSGEEASIWMLDPNALALTRVAQVDRSAVPAGQTDTAPGDIGNWETSGILDVTALFQTRPGETLLVGDVQAHSVRGGVIDAQNLAEGGQLFFLSARSVPPGRQGGVRAPGAGAQAADALALDAPAPNPVRATATVQFSTPEGGPVALRLYDALGREVRTLVDAYAEAGAHTVRLDAAGLASGVYILRMQTPQQSLAREVLVVE